MADSLPAPTYRISIFSYEPETWMVLCPHSAPNLTLAIEFQGEIEWEDSAHVLVLVLVSQMTLNNVLGHGGLIFPNMGWNGADCLLSKSISKFSKLSLSWQPKLYPDHCVTFEGFILWSFLAFQLNCIDRRIHKIFMMWSSCGMRWEGRDVCF